MKRVDDQTMMEMHENGTTKRAIAEHFGVSEQYIGRRVNQLQSYRLPESFEKLTAKQQKFALAVAEGRTNTDAAMSAFDCVNRSSAKAVGYAQSKDPDVAVAITELLHQEGIGRRRRIQRLRDMIESNDLTVVGKGLEIANKLTGEYGQEHDDRSTLFQQINIMVQATRDHLKQKRNYLRGDDPNIIKVKNED